MLRMIWGLACQRVIALGGGRSVYTYLGGDEQLLPSNARLLDSHANFGLGSVHLGAVKMTVSGGDGTLDRIDCRAVQGMFLGLVPSGSGAESEGGDERTPGKLDGGDSGCHWGIEIGTACRS